MAKNRLEGVLTGPYPLVLDNEPTSWRALFVSLMVSLRSCETIDDDDDDEDDAAVDGNIKLIDGFADIAGVTRREVVAMVDTYYLGGDTGTLN